ncbi:MAG: S1 RNA-binding domain-containing protein [Lachnospiraceae bacterium]|jgi:predicted RNA-binding protein (virulence factor B family)|nr:S1 RNA-binding domain-containing protein [Lachnospiraceae bacterium]
MIELGKVQKLTVAREKEFGVFLVENVGDTDAVLLPRKQIPEGTKIGDELTVFIYKDSADRPIATTSAPKLEVGQTAMLEVKEVGAIGAFLDMGLEKDLLLPFREQVYPVQEGQQVLVALYVDKSDRLAATMRVYQYMSNKSPFQKEDVVQGIVYEHNDHLGAFVAVDGKYFGLIPRRELFEKPALGDEITARVLKVRDDGKLDLSIRQKAYLQMDEDAQRIWDELEKQGGFLPFTDKTDPQRILRAFGLSKNAFKRAVGRLLKEGRITLEDTGIKRNETA